MTRKTTAKPGGQSSSLSRRIVALRRLARQWLPAECGQAAVTAAICQVPRGPLVQADQAASEVLVISADSRSGASLARTLADDGFGVQSAATVDGALDILQKRNVAMVVVCGQSVTGTCLSLRQVTSAPILVLLPVMAEDDVLDAFAAGADDCQSAIIGDREVVLRVRAVLRRTRPTDGLS